LKLNNYVRFTVTLNHRIHPSPTNEDNEKRNHGKIFPDIFSPKFSMHFCSLQYCQLQHRLHRTGTKIWFGSDHQQWTEQYEIDRQLTQIRWTVFYSRSFIFVLYAIYCYELLTKYLYVLLPVRPPYNLWPVHCERLSNRHWRYIQHLLLLNDLQRSASRLGSNRQVTIQQAVFSLVSVFLILYKLQWIFISQNSLGNKIIFYPVYKCQKPSANLYHQRVKTTCLFYRKIEPRAFEPFFLQLRMQQELNKSLVKIDLNAGYEYCHEMVFASEYLETFLLSYVHMYAIHCICFRIYRFFPKISSATRTFFIRRRYELIGCNVSLIPIRSIDWFGSFHQTTELRADIEMLTNPFWFAVVLHNCLAIFTGSRIQLLWVFALRKKTPNICYQTTTLVFFWRRFQILGNRIIRPFLITRWNCFNSWSLLRHLRRYDRYTELLKTRFKKIEIHLS